MTSPSKVVVRLPAEMLRTGSVEPNREERWQTRLEELFRSLSKGFRPEGAPSVEVTTAQREPEVTIDGRPAAVGLSGLTTADAVLDDLAQRLIRRSELLSRQPCRTSSVQAYLGDLGVAPHRANSGTARARADVHQAAEKVIDKMEPDEIIVQGPASMLRQASEDDLDLVRRRRHRSFFDHGLLFPDVRMRPVAEPSDGVLRLCLNDVWVPVHGLDADAGWKEVVAALVRLVAPRMHWFLRNRDVSSSLNELGYLMPDLVQSCLDCYSLSTVTAVLREIARGSRSIRNLGRLVWLLLDVGGAEAGRDRFAFTETPRWPRRLHGSGPRATPGAGDDPVVLAALVRKALNEEAWRIGSWKVPGELGRLSAATEDQLTAVSQTKDCAELARLEWRALAEVTNLRHPGVLVVREAAAIPPVASCMQALPEPPRVLSSQELPPDVDMANARVAGHNPTRDQNGEWPGGEW